MLWGCKTTEANYRAAYERAVAGRDSLPSIENTVYGRHRRATSSTVAAVGTDTIEVISARVRVSEGGGAIRENLKRYNVVVGQFKQSFNAMSMRERLVDGGYPGAFVVETGEPFFYVVASTYPTREEALKAAVAIRKSAADFPVGLREGMPVVLYTPL